MGMSIARLARQRYVFGAQYLSCVPRLAPDSLETAKAFHLPRPPITIPSSPNKRDRMVGLLWLADSHLVCREVVPRRDMRAAVPIVVAAGMAVGLLALDAEEG